MLTAITLQNFKGIGAEPMRVPIKPITILFGANSIGKSTIVQAIHYAREILERSNLDPDKTLAGGSAVDLGGFKSLVHNHDLNNKIVLRFDLDLSETDLPSYRFHVDEQPHDWSSWAQSAWVELTVQWSQILERPVLVSYQTALNGVPAVKIETALDGANIITAYNHNHHIFSSYIAGFNLENEQTSASVSAGTDEAGVEWVNLILLDLPASLPRWGELLIFDDETSPEGYVPEHFSHDISQALIGPGELLRDLLRRFRYLGPLRRTLPRNHRPTLTPDESLWAEVGRQ